jgi:hypothetical protein
VFDHTGTPTTTHVPYSGGSRNLSGSLQGCTPSCSAASGDKTIAARSSHSQRTIRSIPNATRSARIRSPGSSAHSILPLARGKNRRSAGPPLGGRV